MSEGTAAQASPAEIAVQYHRSAGPSRAPSGAWSTALEAAERAQATGAHDEAATFLRMALDFLPADDPRRPHLLGRLGIVLAWALDFDEAVEVAAQAGTAIAEAETKEAAAEYLSDAAYVCSQAGGIAPSWTLARQGLTYASGRDVAWARLVCFDYQRREAEDPDPPGAAHRQLPNAGSRPPSCGLLTSTPSGPPRWRPSSIPGRRRASTPNLMVRGLLGRGVRAACAAARGGGSRGGVARSASPGRPGPGPPCPIAREHSVVSARRGSRSRSADALAARLGMPVPTTIYPRQVLSAVMDEGWEQLSATFSYLTSSEDPALAWVRRPGLRRRDPGGCPPGPARRRLSRHSVGWSHGWSVRLRGCRGSPPWREHATDALWLLERHDHADVIERALREKILPAEFRSPVAEARSTLGRLCALTGRFDEAVRWFAEARRVLTEEGVRPLLAICDFDEALMYVRRGDAHDGERAKPLHGVRPEAVRGPRDDRLDPPG